MTGLCSAFPHMGGAAAALDSPPASQLARTVVRDPQAFDARQLKLDAALQLLRQAQRLPAEGLSESSPQWLQAVIDGLCELSSRDALTGLANRRHFEMALEREIDRVARAGEPALMLVQIGRA